MTRIQRLLVAAVVCFVAQGVVWAQQVEITVDSKPTDAEICGWLSLDDLRLVAWGAYFARLGGGDTALTLLHRQVDRWNVSEGHFETNRERREMMSAVLDALIQRRETVSTERIGVLAGTFGPEALILASRLPIAETTPLLMGWYGEGKDNSGMGRIAAMMLAKAPPEGFAASVLAHAEAKDYVFVRDEPKKSGAGYGRSSIGDGFPQELMKGWPPRIAYVLEENSRRGDLLVDAGGDRITYLRSGADYGFGTNMVPRGLDDVSRLHLLAEMLGISAEAMPWGMDESDFIVWRDDGDYRLRVDEIIRSNEAQLQSTVAAFAAKGLVTKSESLEVRPKLWIFVMDERKLHRSMLPEVVSKDARTVIVVKAQEPE